MADRMRIDRILANLGYGTRSEIKKAIRQGSVTVNGTIVKDAGLVCDTERDEIIFNGSRIVYEPYVYLMMNKPAGVISATEGNDPTVLDLIEQPVKGLSPCGRLDKDAEGLLLITNDGPLIHNLLSPKFRVEKEYAVELREELTEEAIRRIESGVTWNEEIIYRPAVVRQTSSAACTITVTEGKFHEVKRIFETVGNEVIYLKRLRMKNLVLDPALEAGEYRALTEEEKRLLKE